MPITTTKPKKHFFPEHASIYEDSQVHCDGMLYDAGVGYTIKQIAIEAGNKALEIVSPSGEDGPTAHVRITVEDEGAGYVIVDYRILGPFLVHVMRDKNVESVAIQKFHHRAVK